VVQSAKARKASLANLKKARKARGGGGGKRKARKNNPRRSNGRGFFLRSRSPRTGKSAGAIVDRSLNQTSRVVAGFGYASPVTGVLTGRTLHHPLAGLTNIMGANAVIIGPVPAANPPMAASVSNRLLIDPIAEATQPGISGRERGQRLRRAIGYNLRRTFSDTETAVGVFSPVLTAAAVQLGDAIVVPIVGDAIDGLTGLIPKPRRS